MSRLPSAAVAYSPDPQSGQNAWTRRFPLSPDFTYSFGVPLVTAKLFPETIAMVLNAEAESAWQSEQWQIPTFSRSSSAS
jgi:hypothetical protein